MDLVVVLCWRGTNGRAKIELDEAAQRRRRGWSAPELLLQGFLDGARTYPQTPAAGIWALGVTA